MLNKGEFLLAFVATTGRHLELNEAQWSVIEDLYLDDPMITFANYREFAQWIVDHEDVVGEAMSVKMMALETEIFCLERRIKALRESMAPVVRI